MDAFEQIVARLFEVQGYWTRIGYAVEITGDEKRALGKHSLPRPQLDVIAYKPSANELLIIECKSYLDSGGVRADSFHGLADAKGDLFKMFNRAALRATVTAALVRQLRSEGLIVGPDPTVTLILVAGNTYTKQEPELRQVFERNGWRFMGPADVAAGLRAFAQRGYENDAITFVTKLLERNKPRR